MLRIRSSIIGLIIIVYTTNAQQNVRDSLEHQTFQRKYIVHLPTNYSDVNPLPVVIVLHGGSGNYISVQGFTEMNFYSNKYRFLAVYPQGYGIAPPGYTWADGRGTTADQANIDDVGFISNLIDTLYNEYNLDNNRIYICGFSNGGFMTQRLACEIPEKFAAIGALGCSLDSLLFESCNPQRVVPMVYFSGTADPEVPYAGGPMTNPKVTPVVPVDTAVQFWVRNNKCQTSEPIVYITDEVPSDNSTAELFKFTDCDCNANVYFYKLINHGHTWAGIPVPQLPQLGNTNEDIHASDLLWQFFSAHTLCLDFPDNILHLKDIALRVYPNPAKDIIHIESDQEIKTISLFDFTGKKIIEKINRILDIQTMDSGIYLLRVEFKQNKTKTIKVMIE